jgi:hypothetical protein
MSKSKHAKHDEFQKEINRHLKKLLKQAQQEIGQLKKQLGYSQNKTEKTKKDKDLNDCESCGKGVLKTSDLGIRKIISCTNCDYKKIVK